MGSFSILFSLANPQWRHSKGRRAAVKAINARCQKSFIHVLERYPNLDSLPLVKTNSQNSVAEKRKWSIFEFLLEAEWTEAFSIWVQNRTPFSRELLDALTFACQRGKVEAVSLLLSHNVPPNGEHLNPPLAHCRNAKFRIDTAQILLNAGADAWGWTHAYNACGNNPKNPAKPLPVVYSFLERGDFYMSRYLSEQLVGKNDTIPQWFSPWEVIERVIQICVDAEICTNNDQAIELIEDFNATINLQCMLGLGGPTLSQCKRLNSVIPEGEFPFATSIIAALYRATKPLWQNRQEIALEIQNWYGENGLKLIGTERVEWEHESLATASSLIKHPPLTRRARL